MIPVAKRNLAYSRATVVLPTREISTRYMNRFDNKYCILLTGSGVPGKLYIESFTFYFDT
jgi:hypothetical protein